MYIHRESKTIYLAHPRTASYATVAALEPLGFHKWQEDQGHHLRLKFGPQGMLANRNDWFVFTTIRNHWDAIISWTFAKHGGEAPREWNLSAIKKGLSDHYHPGLNEPVRNRFIHRDLPGYWQLYHLHADDSNRILRYENIESDLQRVLIDRGFEPPELTRVNASPGRTYWNHRRYYDNDMADFVYTMFRKEIDKHGYTF